VRANVLTRFNAILGTLLAVVLLIGAYRDALFGIVLVSNALIGIVQEVRAKHTLDRLTVLSAPRATVIRTGHARQVPVEEIVLDDVVELHPGDQVPVDGTVLSSAALEVDESLLTGEADPVLKQQGEQVLSGSFVVAGTGRLAATRVGADAYATIPEGLVLLTSLAFAVGVIRLGRRRALVPGAGRGGAAGAGRRGVPRQDRHAHRGPPHAGRGGTPRRGPRRRPAGRGARGAGLGRREQRPPTGAVAQHPGPADHAQVDRVAGRGSRAERRGEPQELLGALG
jgi:hypothetical protein